MIKYLPKIAITMQEQQVSYGRLLHSISYFGQTLACEVAKFRTQTGHHSSKERILVISENRIAYAYTVFGIWASGSIVVPVDMAQTASDVAYIIDDCEPAVVCASLSKKALVDESLKISQHKPRVVVIDEVEQSVALPSGNAEEEYRKLYEGKVVVPYNDSDDCLVVYTSGTTGSPKGVVLTFGNLLYNVGSVSKSVPIFSEDVCTMILLPLHHILPLMGSLIAPLVTGGSIAICPSLQAKDLMETMVKNQVGILIGVPRLYTTLIKGITDKINSNFVTRALYKFAALVNNRKFSSILFASIRKKMGGKIKYFVSGGASLDPEIAQAMKNLGLDLLEGYGMSECAPLIAFTRPGQLIPGSSGLPSPGTQIDIRDGEICVKGPGIMRGYYNRPAETAQVLVDGWLHTGDLGYVDKSGKVWITGRRKEIIVLSNGKNVNPNEIEYKLENYSEIIKEVGVTVKGDLLHAIIVPQPQVAALPDHEIDQILRQQVIEPYNADVAPYKKVMSWQIYRMELPRTKLEKLQRFKLQDIATRKDKEAKDDKDGQNAELSAELAMLIKHIKDEKKLDAKPTDHVEMDLAMDSLDKVGLQVFIQSSFGVELTTDQITAYKNLEELSKDIAVRKTKMEATEIDWKEILRQHTKVRLPQGWATGSIFVWLSKPLLYLYFKLTGKGADNIPEDGPVIIAPNHQSYLDGLFVMSLLKYRSIKNTYFYAKEKHVKQPFLRFMANHHNIIVVDMNNLRESIQKLGEALKRSKNLIIFPEGTRTNDGSIGEFKKTFAILSKELKVPIVPVSIRGAYEAMPKGSFLPRPRKVEVEFLKPVYPNENDSYDDLSADVREAIEEASQK